MILERVGKRPSRLHVHWFRVDGTAGVNRYETCRCGSRQVRRVSRYGYSPVDRNWLLTGRWTPAPTRGPAGPAGITPRVRRTR